MAKTVLVDARFVGSGSALGRYAEQLLLHLLSLSSSFKIRPILNPRLKNRIPPRLLQASPVWAAIPHYSFKEQLDFTYILRRAKPDLIHFTHFNAPIFAPRPFVVTIHDLTISKFRDKTHTPLKRWAYQFLLKRIARAAQHIIAISQATALDVEQILGIPEGKISTIYLGIESKFRPQSEEAILELKKKYRLSGPFILYAGQWRPHKNLLRLFEAFAILKREYRIEEKLVLIGPKDPRYPEVPEKVKELGLEKEIRFLGFVEEEFLPAIYSAASLLVMPSLAEGFGFPPLEAMACGTPVAASFIACLRETLDDAAQFFDPYDVRDIAVKIHSALTNQKLRALLKERGRKWVKRYQWQKTAQKTLLVYQNVIANSGN